MMDLSQVLVAFSTGGLAVTRYPPSTYDSNGRAVVGSPSTLTVPGVVIPLNGREVMNLPEGIRTKENRWAFTTTELYAGKQGSQEADVLSVDGDTFMVMQKMQYSTLANYYQYMIQKVGS